MDAISEPPIDLLNTIIGWLGAYYKLSMLG